MMATNTKDKPELNLDAKAFTEESAANDEKEDPKQPKEPSVRPRTCGKPTSKQNEPEKKQSEPSGRQKSSGKPTSKRNEPKKQQNGSSWTFENCKDIHFGNTLILNQNLTQQNFVDSFKDLKINGQEKSSVKVPQHVLDSSMKLDHQIMSCVAEHIGIKWRKLANFLPPGNLFSAGQLENISHGSPDLEGTAYKILERWREARPTDATVGSLAKALKETGSPDIAVRLEGYLK